MNPRAPAHYGAWVNGNYYSPGAFMPRSTTHFTVTEYYQLPAAAAARSGHTTMAVHYRVAVGTPFLQIAAAMSSRFAAILGQGSFSSSCFTPD